MKKIDCYEYCELVLKHNKNKISDKNLFGYAKPSDDYFDDTLDGYYDEDDYFDYSDKLKTQLELDLPSKVG